MSKTLKIGLVGAGMFGSEVHLPTYAQLSKYGLLPWLGRVGLDNLAPKLGDLEVKLLALATRSETTAQTRKEEFKSQGLEFDVYHGETPWLNLLDAHPDLDILAVATPDHLHAAPVIAALDRGVHCIVEKPMVLNAYEADIIVEKAYSKNLLVGLDMHKRYDPDHLRIRDELAQKIGKPIYGRATLEEPLSIPTEVFKAWAEKSDPFSYVGCHWTDLFIAYYKVKPVSLHAVGQKIKLRNEFNIDAFDAAQVKVQFDNGMSIDFINNWIVPDAFEAPVNQESMIFGTEGFCESDSQYRGLRFHTSKRGTQTANTHFTRMLTREDGTQSACGYGVDSLVACIAKVAELKYLDKTLEDLEGTYPTAKEGRMSVLIIHAAREVMQRNAHYLDMGKGAPVTALFNKEGITIFDPYTGPLNIYDRPV